VSAEILAPLRASIATLPGLGPKLSALLAKLVGGDAVRDVLFHLPVDFVDRRQVAKIRQASPGAIATLRVEVIRHGPAASRGHRR
jgi:ATP-dependent DNA helicase RecG